MTKFGLGKLFQYNPEIGGVQILGRIDITWVAGTWRHPDEWVFAYRDVDCKCHVFDVGFFGISFLSKTCAGRFDL
jgi:hypothetical protein